MENPFTPEELQLIALMLQKADPLDVFDQVQQLKQKIRALVQKTPGD